MRTPRPAAKVVASLFLSVVAAKASLAASPAPVLTPAFFAAHRQAFVAGLPAGAIAIVRTAPETSVETSPDPYRQNSDFWYLTGFGEPDAVAVLRPWAAEGERYILFVRAAGSGEGDLDRLPRRRRRRAAGVRRRGGLPGRGVREEVPGARDRRAVALLPRRRRRGVSRSSARGLERAERRTPPRRGPRRTPARSSTSCAWSRMRPSSR